VVTDAAVPTERALSATSQLLVADLTYVATWSGFGYCAFIINVSRRIVGHPPANDASIIPIRPYGFTAAGTSIPC
jgi:hypothetical protein